MNQNMTYNTRKAMDVVFVVVAIVLMSPASFAYPRVALPSGDNYYVASGGLPEVPSLPSVRYADSWSVPYVTGADGSTYLDRAGTRDPYAEAYYTGYAQARQYYRMYYDDSWDEDRSYVRIGGSPTYPHGPYNFYDISYGREDNRPGLDCNFGRSDICFYRYEACESGWCRIGDSDIANYHYYNPYNVPGYYTIDDRYTSAGWY